MGKEKATCPICGKVSSLVKGVPMGNPGKPRTGELFVCCFCADLSIFDGNLKLQLATPEDYERLEKRAPGFKKKLEKVQWHIKEINKLDNEQERLKINN